MTLAGRVETFAAAYMGIPELTGHMTIVRGDSSGSGDGGTSEDGCGLADVARRTTAQRRRYRRAQLAKAYAFVVRLAQKPRVYSKETLLGCRSSWVVVVWPEGSDVHHEETPRCGHGGLEAEAHDMDDDVQEEEALQWDAWEVDRHAAEEATEALGVVGRDCDAEIGARVRVTDPLLVRGVAPTGWIIAVSSNGQRTTVAHDGRSEADTEWHYYDTGRGDNY